MQFLSVQKVFSSTVWLCVVSQNQNIKARNHGVLTAINFLQYSVPTTAGGFIVGVAGGAASDTNGCVNSALMVGNTITPGISPNINDWAGFVCDSRFCSSNDCTINGVISQKGARFHVNYQADSALGLATTHGYKLQYMQSSTC